jgi:hypothetical protein
MTIKKNTSCFGVGYTFLLIQKHWSVGPNHVSELKPPDSDPYTDIKLDLWKPRRSSLLWQLSYVYHFATASI